MKSLVVGLLIAASVVSPVEFVAALGLPWATFSEAANDAVSVRQGGCPGGAVTSVLLEKDGKSYDAFVSETGDHWVVVLYGPTDVPVYLWSGQLDIRNPDRIRPTTQRSFDPVLDAAGPCPLLYPQAA